jgi:hypothetical protein
LQAWQVPALHAVSQQTPLVQNPEAHWLFELQPSPNDASYKNAALETVLLDESPPAKRTKLLGNVTAGASCTPAGREAVAVHVVVSLNSSADESVLLPVLDPPATSTNPLATILLGRTIMLWPTRGEVMVPADDQVPLENEGSKVSAVANTVDPFLPPVMSILPFEFGKIDAACCSRALDSDASVENALWTGSYRNTDAIVEVPLLPPTKSTRPFNWLFVVVINVEVPKRHPGGGIGPVVAVNVPAPEAGL